jgi:hypothetical protein
MLLEELDESGNGNIESVVTVVVVHAINLGLGCKTLAVLEVLESGLWLGVEDIGQRSEGTSFGVVQKSALLEKERQGLLATGVIVNQSANLGGTGVGDGDDFDQAGGINGVGPSGGKQSADVDIPFCHQPKQRLDGDDRPRKDEGPFLALDVGVIALRGEIKSEEGGPDNQERPDVGMQLQREGIMQGRMFNLGVIGEFRPGKIV